MRLVGVELDRFFARSVVQWLIVAVLILSASSALLALTPATPMPESERARAEADFAEHHAWWLENHEQSHEDCLAAEALDREMYADADWGCEYELIEPELANWLWETSFTESGLDIIDAITLGLLFLVLMTAVSFVAAEFSSGAIGNWLTFEPRRVRVYLAKLVAAMIGAVAISLVGYAVAVAAAYVPFAIYGTTGEVTSETWRDLAAGGGRFILAGALTATIGVALAFLLRHLAAAIGVAIGWLLIIEQLGSFAYPTFQKWSVSTNLNALRSGGTEYFYEACSIPADGGQRVCEWTGFPVTALQGGLVLGGIAVVLTVVALVVFRRRDVS